jgi:hypothetical protein
MNSGGTGKSGRLLLFGAASRRLWSFHRVIQHTSYVGILLIAWPPASVSSLVDKVQLQKHHRDDPREQPSEAGERVEGDRGGCRHI